MVSSAFAAGIVSVLLLSNQPLVSLNVQSAARLPSGRGLDDKPVELWKIANGQPVVLLFVRTDCPISNRYAPKIAKLQEEFSGKVRFWLVYPGPDESPARIRTHLREYRYSIPALRDERHELVEAARATITPEAAVFDATAKLIYHGRIDNWYEDFGRSRQVATTHELEEAIHAALDGRPANPDHANAVGCYIADVK